MNVVIVDNRAPLHSQHPVVRQKHSMTTKLIETLSNIPQLQVVVITTVEAASKIQFKRVDMLFLSGSAMHITYPNDVLASRPAIVSTTQALAHNVPIVGICFGAQLLSWMMGGKVVNNPSSNTKPYIYGTDFGSMYFNHTDAITEAPQGFKVLSRHAMWGYILTMWDTNRRILLTQWHPEGTEDGRKFLQTFIKEQLNKKFPPNKHNVSATPTFEGGYSLGSAANPSQRHSGPTGL